MKFNYLLEIYDTLISEILNSRKKPTREIIDFINSLTLESFYILDILQKEKQLKEKQQLLTNNSNADSILENLRKTLEDNLNLNREELKMKSQVLSESRGTLRTIRSKNQILKEILREKKAELKKQEGNLNKNLVNLKTENEKALKPLKDNINQKQLMKESLEPQLKMNLEADINGYTNKLLNALVKEIAQEMTYCPKELRQYLNYGDYATVMQLNNKLSKDIEKEYNTLQTELTKLGINNEWFLKNL